jgi:hypothetical protein
MPRALPSAALLLAASAGGCADGGADTCAALLPGDLVITEVFADPTGPDDGGEWFEVFNASDQPIVLDGITLVSTRGDGSKRRTSTVKSGTVEPGAYIVFGNVAADLRPPWVDIGYGNGLRDLYNTGVGRLALQCGSKDLASAVYDNVRSGRSRQREGDQWCDTSRAPENEFSAGNFGTPGQPNEDCEIIIPGMCDDGTGLRSTVVPAPGDLVITEVMPNPAATPDTSGEWFEVMATRDLDLNGITLDRLGDSANGVVVQAERCLHVPAGSYAVFARSADATVNGGLPAVAGTFGFSLVSGSTTTPGDVAVLYGSTLLDAATWTSSRSGASLQRDTSGNWCAGSTPYGAGDLGSPGAANAPCEVVPPAGMCLDNGTLRAIVKPVVGQLAITEIMPNPKVEPAQEWFEIANVGAVAFDLNELGLDRENDTRQPDLVLSSTCKRVAPGGFALFARSADATANGMLPTPDALFGFSMVNSSGEVRVLDGTTVLDAVTWTTSTDGVSSQRDPDLSRFCNSTTAYGDLTNKGSPRAANAPCP